MTDNIKKQIDPYLKIFIFIFIIIMSVIMAQYAMRYVEIKNNNIKNLTQNIEYKNNTIKNLTQRITIKEKELTINIKKYIKHNYPTTPNILAKEIANQISKLSLEENIAPELIVGIIQVESSFNPMAISKKNARGLMQVMPMWAKEFKLKNVCDLHNIETGIRIGIKVLKIHIQEQNGDLSQGLYYYVNKDKSYVERVYKAMGLFVFKNEINKGEIDDFNNTTINRDTRIVKTNKG